MAGGRLWTGYELRFLRKAAGVLPVRTVAQRLSRSVCAIEHKASRLNISTARPGADGGCAIPFSPEENDALRGFANETIPSFEKAATALGRTLGSVKGQALRLGLSFKSREKAARQRRGHSANFRFFESIHDERRAYWLGVLGADGCIVYSKACRSAMLTLGVQARDREWLEAFRSDLGATHPIHFRDAGTDGPCRLAVTSWELCGDLVEAGLRQNKKYEGFDVPALPAELLHHYVRGLFDGDGSVNRHSRSGLQVTIAGRPEICDWLLRVIRQHTGIKGGCVMRPYRDALIRVVYIAGRHQVRAFYEWLYRDATRFLGRKRDRFAAEYGR